MTVALAIIIYIMLLEGLCLLFPDQVVEMIYEEVR